MRDDYLYYEEILLDSEEDIAELTDRSGSYHHANEWMVEEESESNTEPLEKGGENHYDKGRLSSRSPIGLLDQAL